MLKYLIMSTVQVVVIPVNLWGYNFITFSQAIFIYTDLVTMFAGNYLTWLLFYMQMMVQVKSV